jgi:hypothetical protein
MVWIKKYIENQLEIGYKRVVTNPSHTLSNDL